MKTTSLLLVALCAILSFGWYNDYSSYETNKSVTGKRDVKTGTRIGDKAPEIKLSGPDGKQLALSSLKGKIVLIDFWASWCKPCRWENPNLVLAYQKYKSAKFKNAKGFEIYSISLDRSKSAWVKAIEKDNLGWKYHVSDLKFWNSDAAKTYGVNSIPMNFIIDANGIIIAKNLRGQKLHYEMDKLVDRFKK